WGGAAVWVLTLTSSVLCWMHAGEVQAHRAGLTPRPTAAATGGAGRRRSRPPAAGGTPARCAGFPSACRAGRPRGRPVAPEQQPHKGANRYALSISSESFSIGLISR